MAIGRQRLAGILNGMKTRCTNPNRKDYQRYGGVGITVCDEWSGKDGFKNFCDWAVSNGYSDELTIDRIDNTFGYSPNNCRWVTQSDQCRNRKSNHLVEYAGETKPIIEWAEIAGLRKDTFRKRLIEYGWSMEKIMSTPTIRKAVREDRDGR